MSLTKRLNDSELLAEELNRGVEERYYGEELDWPSPEELDHDTHTEQCNDE